MKSLFFTTLLVFFVASSANRQLSKEENRFLQEHCGNPISQVAADASATSSDAPWVVALQKRPHWYPGISDDEEEETICTGTLISSRHVLTAATCIDEFYKSLCQSDGTLVEGKFSKVNIRRFIFDHKNTDDFADISVNKIFYSSKYNGPNCANRDKNVAVEGDIAIFELSKDVPFSEDIHPACLNARELQQGEKLIQFRSSRKGNSESVVSECGEIEPASDTVCDRQEFQSVCKNNVLGAGKFVFDSRGFAFLAAVVPNGLPCWLYNHDDFDPQPHFSINVIPHLQWICAATGICVNEKLEKTVEKYKRLGFLGNKTEWFKTILPLKGYDIFAK